MDFFYKRNITFYDKCFQLSKESMKKAHTPTLMGDFPVRY